MMARLTRSLIVAAVVALAAVAAPAQVYAQERLLDARVANTGIVIERWSFANPIANRGAASVVGAAQVTVPVTVVVPITPTWAVDAYAAFAHGSVTIDRGSAGQENLALSGPSDVKLRVVGKLRGDNIILTLGASLPSGKTGLDHTRLEALSVLAAPALRFRTPTLGSGLGGTGGIVFAGQAGPWALAFAGSFEFRGSYAPSRAIVAGAGEPALRAGDAVHLSFAADRLVGQARQTVSLIADYFSRGRLDDPAIGSTAPLAFRLGPAVTATYQVQGTAGDLESMFYLLDRVRSNYSVADSTISGSWRNEAELGFVNSYALNPRTSVRLGLDSRFHTAPGSDPDMTVQSFSTAGIMAGGATLGLRFGPTSGSLMLEPFVRAQRGQLDFGGPVRRATGFSGGVTFTGRF